MDILSTYLIGGTVTASDSSGIRTENHPSTRLERYPLGKEVKGATREWRGARDGPGHSTRHTQSTPACIFVKLRSTQPIES